MFLKLAKISYDPVVGYAAEELKRCLEAMDPSVEVLLLTYPNWREDVKDALWLGIDPKFAEALPAVADPELDDAIAIETDGLTGFITGANPRAVLIAAYRFLRELGAAWVRPGKDGELLPCCDLKSRSVSIKELPSCRHRGVCIEGAVALGDVCEMIEWMPRVGMNAYFNQFMIPATFYERWYEHYLNPTMPPFMIDNADVEGMRDTTVFEMKRRGLLYHAAGHGWTCEPFGISGTGWDADRKHDVPEESKQFLALVNGKRGLWQNVPLNTNLCYSNPEVQRRMSDAVADYCADRPEVDYVHVWLADGFNNHCECENCVKKRPADWYIDILNLIDEKMTARGLKAKVVFLMYFDLYWPPVESKLKNPGRFVLMFAPITRTYSHSLGEAGEMDADSLPPYVRNKCGMPRSVEENLCWLREWQKFFPGDCFDYDYHYMWDHLRDVAHMSMNRVLFDDMKAMGKLGMNGMVSCQNQRVWMPSGFGMAAMAEALWDKDADYGETADRYFAAAFGQDGSLTRDYLEQLSENMVPAYFRREVEAAGDEDKAELLGKFAKARALMQAFSPVIARNAGCGCLDAVQRRSWEYLELHRQFCEVLVGMVEQLVTGDVEKAKGHFQRACRWLQDHEPALRDVFDVYEFQATVGRMFQKPGIIF